ncbi:M23 family metallopeptidase, partial [Thermomicrobium sp.]|uniref:M23 family metallopeptidase n=1 Tax=Thermomicrobium sp. TaxID=1969469 RepID=UPI001B1D5F59
RDDPGRRPDEGATGCLAPSNPPAQRQAPRGSFIWPTTGVITQYFHARHNGWDIANNMYTPIVAADSGTVIFSGWNNYGLGYAVAIDHGNGFVTWYGHMAEPPPVQVGQWVNQGQYIGPMGSTGYSTGPHVHFIIMYNGVYQDPALYLR